MARGRVPGKKNRTHPPLPLEKALGVARGMQDEAGGRKTSKLTLAHILDVSPSSSVFRDLVASSRLYGLTAGGINADEFELLQLGTEAVSDDDEERGAALKKAVLNVPPYKAFFDTYASKKVPGAAAFRDFLVREAGIPAEYVEECMSHIRHDMKTAGFVRDFKGSEWVDLSGVPQLAAPVDEEGGDDAPDGEDELPPPPLGEITPTPDPRPDLGRKKRPNKLFVGHGKNKKPLDQLTKVLRDLGIPHLVAEDEPNAGRPVSKKVRDTMEQCGAGILIFSADVEYFDKDGNSVWRPSENVSHELGAAAVMYDDRIIMFKEDGVHLASNYSGIGYIEFEKDRLDATTNELLRELVALKILRMSVDDDED
jgi:hypothetical protein